MPVLRCTWSDPEVSGLQPGKDCMLKPLSCAGTEIVSWFLQPAVLYPWFGGRESGGNHSCTG